MKTGGRPSLNLTAQERYDRKITQAREAKQRRKELRDLLSDRGQVLCHERWCIRPAVEGTRICSYHAGITPKEVKEVKCLHCESIAMPGRKLCGYCDETIGERRSATRRLNRAKKQAEMEARVEARRNGVAA